MDGYLLANRLVNVGTAASALLTVCGGAFDSSGASSEFGSAAVTRASSGAAAASSWCAFLRWSLSVRGTAPSVVEACLPPELRTITPALCVATVSDDDDASVSLLRSPDSWVGGSEYIVDIESIMPALWSVADVDDDDAAGLFVRNSGSSLESSDELVVVESINDLDAEDLDAEDLDAEDLDAEDLDAEDLDAEDLDAEEDDVGSESGASETESDVEDSSAHATAGAAAAPLTPRASARAPTWPMHLAHPGLTVSRGIAKPAESAGWRRTRRVPSGFVTSAHVVAASVRKSAGWRRTRRVPSGFVTSAHAVGRDVIVPP